MTQRTLHTESISAFLCDFKVIQVLPGGILSPCHNGMNCLTLRSVCILLPSSGHLIVIHYSHILRKRLDVSQMHRRLYGTIKFNFNADMSGGKCQRHFNYNNRILHVCFCNVLMPFFSPCETLPKSVVLKFESWIFYIHVCPLPGSFVTFRFTVS